MKPKNVSIAKLLFLLFALTVNPALSLDLSSLRNPVWATSDNLRDPSVFKTKDGYLLFYSRFRAGPWNSGKVWTIACAETPDFLHFNNNHDISPPSCASPGDCVMWGGRYVLPYQFYPTNPVELCFSESHDLQKWSKPKAFLTDALNLPWNSEKRVIDPTFVVVGKTLHCFFVGSAHVASPDLNGKMIHANLIGHAITEDPNLEKWTILTPDQPLIGVTDQAPDGAENLTVFRTGSYWTMIYSEGLVHQHIARAISMDLIHWEKTGPIHIPIQKWMANRYGAPYVWIEGDSYFMILMGEDTGKRTTLGLLTSKDGETWTILPGQ